MSFTCLYDLLLILLFASWATVCCSRSICTHCYCNEHLATVICSGQHMVIRSVQLPLWAENLHFEQMLLQDIPHFVFNDRVKTLRIHRCQLEQLPPSAFKSFPSLEELYISNNFISQLPRNLIFHLRSLRVLDLSHNLLTDLRSLTDVLPQDHVLERLVLSGNPLELSTAKTRLPLARQLFLSASNVRIINETVILLIPSTRCAVSEDCRVVPISQKQWSLLELLDLSAQRHLSISLSALKMLANATDLNFADANLSAALIDWLTASSQVRYLNLSHARLSEGLQSSWEWCARNLEWLDISNMQLQRLVVPRDCQIKHLRANGNFISTVLVSSATLENLYLEHNNISSWIFGPFENLEILSLKSNQLQGLPENALVGYPKLRDLDVSVNGLLNISMFSFPSVGLQLCSLNLSHNRLASFPHPVLPSLNLLDISFNGLEFFDPQLFAGLPSLVHFYVRGNPSIASRCSASNCWMSSLAQLSSLTELDLSACNLGTCPDLSSLKALRKLDLSQNRLQNLDGALVPSDLYSLSLAHNQLHRLVNVTAERFRFLRDLELAHNPLLCDCSLLQLLPFLDKPSLQRLDSYYCFSSSWQYSLQAYLDSAGPCLKDRSRFSNFTLKICLCFTAFFCSFTFCFLFVHRYYSKYHPSVGVLYKLVPSHSSNVAEL